MLGNIAFVVFCGFPLPDLPTEAIARGCRPWISEGVIRWSAVPHADLTEMRPGLEVLDVASGKGVPLEYFVREFGVTASGVDIDPAMVEEAESWTRELGVGDRLQFQSGRSDRLPYRDEIFDIAEVT